MKQIIDWKKEWPALALLVLTLLVTLWAFPRLPDPMPTHWNMQNEVDGYSSRAFGAWLMPALMVVLYFLLVVLPGVDPKRKNVERMAGLYRLIRIGIIAFMALIQVVMVTAIIYGRNDLVGRATPALVGVLFLLIGNYMPRMRPNWFMGIRTPWTMSNENVWRKTHLLGGRLFMLAGIAMFMVPLLPVALATPILLGTIIVAALVPIAYSFVLYQRENSAPTP